ncbi:MAG: TraB/GumN family protein, partial [Candidatus Aenigmarchaeota archaeon]|nr:TraB/GumN family protein [Candidatus Aenigmarchaeota archaeon]
LIGTSHVSMEGFEKAGAAMDEADCLALELCPSRYYALRHGSGKPQGIFFRILLWLQKDMGKKTGVQPGADMLKAAELAEAKGKPVFLIDLPMEEIMLSLQKAPLLEKISLFLPGPDFDVSRAPDAESVRKINAEFRKRSPFLYEHLIAKRNSYMAENLRRISEGKRVIAIVGAGHIPGLLELIDAKVI